MKPKLKKNNKKIKNNPKEVKMKFLMKLEEAALFLLSIYLFTQLDYAWWVFAALLLVPDFSMLGYAINNKVGAIIYNVVHFRALAIAIYLIGIFFSINYIALAGIIMFAHSTMDRASGYGLKLYEGFKHTHLGQLK